MCYKISRNAFLTLLNIIFSKFPTNCLYQFTDSLNHIWLNDKIAQYNINLDLFPNYTAQFVSTLLDNTNTCPGMLITTQNEAQIEEVLRRLWYNTTGSRMHDSKLIIVSFASNDTSILRNSMVLKFANVLLLSISDLFVYCYTHKFIGVFHNANKSQKEFLLDVWNCNNEGFLYDTELFPNKIKNEWNKTWVVGSDHSPMYFNLATKSGSHLKTLIEYAKARKITLAEYRFEQVSFASGDRTINYISQEITDVAIGGLYLTSSRYQKAGALSSISELAITCLVPTTRPIYDWSQYIKIFQLEIWVAFLATNIIVFLIVLKFVKPKLSTWFLILGIMLESPTTHIRYLKFLSILLVVLAQFMTMSYCCNLASMIIVPTHNNEINSVNDLIKADIPWYSNDPAIIAPIEDDRTPYFQTLIENMHLVSVTELESIMATTNAVVAAQRLRKSGAITVDTNIDKETAAHYKILKDNILVSPGTIYLHRHSQYLNDFWQFLEVLAGTGLQEHWEYTTDTGGLKIEQYLNKETDTLTHIVLRIDHVKGIFAFWITAVAISLIIFILEIFSQKIMKHQIFMHS